MKITIYDEQTQTSARISLPSPFWSGRREINTGIFLTGIYVGKISKRVIVETDSIWEDRHTHGCVGTKYHLADQEEIASLCERFEGLGGVLESCDILTSESL